MIPKNLTAICNACLRAGCFHENWKIAKIFSIVKPGRENRANTSKCRPISLLNTEGKVLGKLLSKRIMHHLYKTEHLNEHQYGFTLQKITVDAAMEVKQYIEPHLESGGVVLLVSLDYMEPLTRHAGRRYDKGCVKQTAPENSTTCPKTT
jgi:hypothetical protein